MRVRNKCILSVSRVQSLLIIARVIAVPLSFRYVTLANRMTFHLRMYIGLKTATTCDNGVRKRSHTSLLNHFSGLT